MATSLANIKISRLLLAIAVTVAVADACPHPSLGPSLLSQAFQRVQQVMTGRSQETRSLVTEQLSAPNQAQLPRQLDLF
ncbi:hypothetical protein XM38_000100 [Halomicronema hongdechloris C2206]|uniref:Uncharacterized protein n=1 Tax=Halomicronema hongdechloris C2206 TaxID=1641165 RepID=A0A1Z3HFK9_9CYAN|nr:hypothetical protein [Halomicronema hongdechloris]ASC69084.1 hypothetical protein XM38_000100 [Halomicronema hongdechloris C2206]